jgi:hypothetical protein
MTFDILFDDVESPGKVIGAVAAGYLFAARGVGFPLSGDAAIAAHNERERDVGGSEPDLEAVSEHLANLEREYLKERREWKTHRDFDRLKHIESPTARWRKQARFARRIWLSGEISPPDWRRFAAKIKRLANAIDELDESIRAFKIDDRREFFALTFALANELAFRPDVGIFDSREGRTSGALKDSGFIGKEFPSIANGLSLRLYAVRDYLQHWSHHDRSAIKYAAIWHICFIWWSVTEKYPTFSNNFSDDFSDDMLPFQKFAYNILGRENKISPTIFREVVNAFRKTLMARQSPPWCEKARE